MKEIQEKVNEMIKKYNLESPIEVRFIDLVSEVGELGKEILKGNEYGKKLKLKCICLINSLLKQYQK